MKKSKVERRFLETDLKIEYRNSDDKTDQMISGYAAVFNRDSEDMGFIEQIAPGAFTEALKRSNVKALFNHDPNIVIGAEGVNLTLRQDETGLFMELTEIDTPNYKSVAADIRAGVINKQSFAFTVEEDEWSDVETDTPRRTIRRVGKLLDVSPVTYPAYPDSTVGMRSLDKQKELLKRDREKSNGHEKRMKQLRKMADCLIKEDRNRD